jgi:hypothetical protein
VTDMNKKFRPINFSSDISYKISTKHVKHVLKLAHENEVSFSELKFN